MKIKVDKTLRDLLPPLADEEFAALRQDIKRNGVLNPILVAEDGVILDGHHRFRVDKKAPFKVIKGLTQEVRLAFVLRSNLHRRNLSSEQKAEVRAKQMRLAIDLKKARRTQKEIGELLGVPRATVARWLTNNVHPNKGSRDTDVRIVISPTARVEVLEQLSNGKSQRQVAANLGVSQQSISKIKTNHEKSKHRKRSNRQGRNKRQGSWKDEVRFQVGDCLKRMKKEPDDSVDLVFTSPPYEDARTYGIDFKLIGDKWVDWMFDRVVESLRICRGLVAVVVDSRTKNYRYSPTPLLLMSQLHEAGYSLRKPVIFRRHGLPGTGGPDFLRNDYEFVLCVTRGGRLPWSDNKAMGHPPKRTSPCEVTNRNRNGSRKNLTYLAPDRANPGNVIDCVVGGGNMGSKLCHENEAPFPESLAEFFIRSFCPPGGTVLDPFCGSGTTAAVAYRNGRNSLNFDIRKSQIRVAKQRLREVSETRAAE